MNSAKIIRGLAPFTIFLIAVIFIWNLISHGSIQHPGKTSYKNLCAQCHGDNGEGIKELTPPLLQSDFAKQHFDSIPCWLKHGMSHPIVVNGVQYDQPMYPIEVNEIQTANIINYISKEFLKYDTTVNSIWVQQQWKNCE